MSKVFITDYFKEANIEKSILGNDVELVCLNQSNEDNFPESIKEATALLVWHTNITSTTINKLKNCKAIIRYGVGYDNIDINFAKKNKIPCANTPDYGTTEVADTACALMLNLMRKINIYNNKSKSYKHGWQENVILENKNNPVLRLSECKLGIIGYGRIGSAVAKRMKEFGLQICFFDPYVNNNNIKKIIKVNSIDELIKFSNVISFNCNLNKETRNLVDNKFINKLTDNTIIVNTARGSIISNLDCLLEGLEKNKLGAVGLDVLPDEPPNSNEKFIKVWKDANHPLNNKIIINPHSAYFSSRSIVEMREKAAKNILRALNGLKILNQVN